MNTIDRLKNNTSGGPDNLSVMLVKSIATTISPCLLTIMNGILHLGHHPQPWKHSTTTILRKNGKPDYRVPKAYRPIALLCIFTRILEGLMAKRLSHLSETRGLFEDNQNGFRKNRQTADGLVELKKSIVKNWSQKRVTSGCSLDMRGAYDSIDHDLLVEKLEIMGLPSYITKWLTNFLHNRTTYLTNEAVKSKLLFLLRGLPQGSPISPVLFNLFSSDLVRDLSALVPTTSFADDLFIYTSNVSIDSNLTKMKHAFEVATNWGIKNKMSFDFEKTNLIHFCRRQPKKNLATFVLKLDDATITPKDHILFLGVYFDTRLTWKIHIEHMV